MKSPAPPKPELATWKAPGVTNGTDLMVVITVDTGILEFVGVNETATHLQRVCWGPRSLVSLWSWCFYLFA